MVTINQSAIIKRIDELGRIIIPKSIRSELRIKTGDLFKICIEEEKIIISKYNELSKLYDVIYFVGETIYNELRKSVLILDNKNVIFSSNEKFNNMLVDKKIIDINNAFKGKVNFKMFNNDIDQIYYIFPLKKYGDRIGTIIVFGNEIEEKDIEYVNLFSNFIKNYIEQKS